METCYQILPLALNLSLGLITWNNKAFMAAFRGGLAGHIKEELSGLDIQSFLDIITLATGMYMCFKNRAQEKEQYSCFSIFLLRGEVQETVSGFVLILCPEGSSTLELSHLSTQTGKFPGLGFVGEIILGLN